MKDHGPERTTSNGHETQNPYPGDGEQRQRFADLGFAEPEEELTKAQLASHIRRILKRRRLTLVSAAELMGIDQPKVSAPSGRLMRFLTALGHDVDIVVRPAKAGPNRAHRGRIQALAG